MDYVTCSPKSNQKKQKMGSHSRCWCIYLCICIRHKFKEHVVTTALSAFQNPSWFSCTVFQNVGHCALKHLSKPCHHEPYLALNFILPKFSEFYFHICLTVLCFNTTFATQPHGSCERLCFITDSLPLILYVAKGWE